MNKEREHKLYWVIALLLFIIFLLADCEGNKIPTEDCGEIKSITYDTVTTVSRTVDTIKFIDTVKYYVKVEVPTPFFDTISNLNIYTAGIEDSLIIGSITSKVDGVLVNQDFEYTPKFPKYIIITDTVTNNITETITKVLPKKRELYMGLYAGGNTTTFNLMPVLSFKDKKDRMFSYGYNVIDNTHNVGFQTKIKLK